MKWINSDDLSDTALHDIILNLFIYHVKKINKLYMEDSEHVVHHTHVTLIPMSFITFHPVGYFSSSVLRWKTLGNFTDQDQEQM